jgi:hypothetical protein
VEPLAFVDVLGRHGEVLARHSVTGWPAFVGRNYDGEVILDDPYVAPRHLRIEPAADGRFAVSDLQTANGVMLLPSGRRVVEAQVGPEDVLRIGQTQIRIRSVSYSAKPEILLRAAGVHRRLLGFAISAAALLALVLWSAWIATANQDEKIYLVYPAIGVCVVVGLWIAVWALVGRAAGGRDNFPAHGFVACASVCAIMVADTLSDYLSFGLDSDWLEYIGIAAAAGIFTYMIYRHLRLNSRSSRKRLAVVSAIASLAVSSALAGLQAASDWRPEGRMRYDRTIKAPAFLWVKGAEVPAFLGRGEKLKKKVDALARAER